jgi:protein required for attachment to host cells
MKGTWIVIANSSVARCYSREDEHAPWSVVAELDDAMGRAKGIDMVSDRSGYEGVGRGVGRGHAGTSFEPRLDPRRKEHEAFAHRVAVALGEAVAAGRCSALVLFASSPFLGEVKSMLGAHATKVLQQSHAVDLTSYTGAELAQRIEQHLAKPA